MAPELVTAPTVEVVSVGDLREYLRIDGSEEDYLIQTLRDAAVAHLDGWKGILGRAIMSQTWREEFTAWGDLRLSLPDVSSATVTYQDENDAWQSATGTLRHDDRGWYVETEEAVTTERIRVEYDCALPSEQLPAVVIAVKMIVSHWFDNRGVMGVAGEMPLAVDAILAPLRWGRG